MGKPLYDGPATIRAVEFSDLGAQKYKRESLSEDQVAESFEVHLKLEYPGENGNAESVTVSLEFSPREGTGKMAGKIQSDVSMQSLEMAGLVENGDISMITQKVGAEVRIWQKSSGEDGKYINTYLGGGAQKIDQTEMARRFAKLNGLAKPLDAPATGGNQKPKADDVEYDPFG